jgi:hypothetical protein
LLIHTVLLTGAASVGGGGGGGEGGRRGAAENQGVEEGAGAWEIVVVSRYVPQITHWIALAAIKWAAYGH